MSAATLREFVSLHNRFQVDKKETLGRESPSLLNHVDKFEDWEVHRNDYKPNNDSQKDDQ